MSQGSCPICHSDAKEVFISKHNHRISKCKSDLCGHLFVTEPNPNQGVMNKDSSSSEIDDISRQLQETYAERNERLIDYWKSKKFLGERTKLLDFGSGSGHILKSLKNRYREITITSIEDSKPFQDHLLKYGFNIADSIDNVEGKFDSILLIEVIEHVPDPLELLRKVKSKLNSDGKIFLTTPCGELRNGSRETNAYDEETHIHFFTEKSLKLACNLAGLKPIVLEDIEAMNPEQKQPIKKLWLGIKLTARKLLELSSLKKEKGFSHLTGFITFP